jgi:hypothetical protein
LQSHIWVTKSSESTKKCISRGITLHTVVAHFQLWEFFCRSWHAEHFCSLNLTSWWKTVITPKDECYIYYFFTEVIKFYWLMLLLYPGELYRLLGASSIYLIFKLLQRLFKTTSSLCYGDKSVCRLVRIIVFKLL